MWIIVLLILLWCVAGAVIGGCYIDTLSEPKRKNLPDPPADKLALIVLALGPIAWFFGLLGVIGWLFKEAHDGIDKFLYPEQVKKK